MYVERKVSECLLIIGPVSTRS